jgi:hypothetical protein
LSDVLNTILNELAQNDALRNAIIVDYNLSEPNSASSMGVMNSLTTFLDDRIENKAAYNYSARICWPDTACGLNPYPKDAAGDVFADSKIISSTLEEYGPKKVKLFIWRRK